MRGSLKVMNGSQAKRVKGGDEMRLNYKAEQFGHCKAESRSRSGKGWRTTRGLSALSRLV